MSEQFKAQEHLVTEEDKYAPDGVTERIDDSLKAHEMALAGAPLANQRLAKEKTLVFERDYESAYKEENGQRPEVSIVDKLEDTIEDLEWRQDKVEQVTGVLYDNEQSMERIKSKKSIGIATVKKLFRVDRN